ncbi:MAG TPA: hypothetical protein VM689_20550 [Aliidongia sp.]|nr:hypothetical protein [Aliidongia sp.]
MTAPSFPPERSGAETSRPWHLDKRIPVALLVATAVQMLIAGSWFGRTETRLSALESWVGHNQGNDSRLAVIETRLDGVHDALEKIERHLSISE